MAATTRHPAPPGLPIFLAALRWQESGSPGGNYTEPNGQGAYQIIQGNWPTWARQYAGYSTTDPNASHAPKAVQDQVAAGKVTDYYYGAGEQNWRLVARIWNGGTPNAISNPALGPGATTDTYATQVLNKVTNLQQQGYGSDKFRTAILNAIGQPGTHGLNVGTDQCTHKLHVPIRFAPDLNICMDKPLALLALGAGGFLMLVGGAVVLIGAFRETAAGRAATGALAAAGTVLPVARLATAGRAAGSTVKAATPRARATRDAERQYSELQLEQEQLRRDARAARDRATIARNARPAATGRSRTAESLDRPERRPTPRRRPTGTRPARSSYAPRRGGGPSQSEAGTPF